MKNRVKITRKNNQGVIILKVLSLFRDYNIIKIIQEISEFMMKYEQDDEIIINCDAQSLDEIKITSSLFFI